MRIGHFWVKNGPFALNKHILGKIINIIFIYPWPISLGQILKTFYNRPRVYKDGPFLDPNWVNFPKQKLFRKPVDKPSSYHSSLPTRQKINVRCQSIHEILTIKEYWNHIRQEPILSITWEPDFSQTYSFHRILKDHKNFRFTPILDKANDFIFKKVHKILFVGPFWHHFFSKKSLLCHI